MGNSSREKKERTGSSGRVALEIEKSINIKIEIACGFAAVGKEIYHLEALEVVLGRRGHKCSECWRRGKIEGEPERINGFGYNVKSTFRAKYIGLQEYRRRSRSVQEDDENRFRRCVRKHTQRPRLHGGENARGISKREIGVHTRTGGKSKSENIEIVIGEALEARNEDGDSDK